MFRSPAIAVSTSLVIVALGQIGCGGTNHSVSSAPGGGATEITVHYENSGGFRSATLMCGAQAAVRGGRNAQPEAACGYLAHHAEQFRTRSASAAPKGCAARFFGPETVRVQGVLDGSPTDRRFDRHDACAERDFAATRMLIALLGLSA